jgi:hypothetical protein
LETSGTDEVVMKENEYCELLAKAKAEAIRRGLGTVDCPIIKICDGKVCYLNDRLKTIQSQHRRMEWFKGKHA